jgi:hypothetical protein
MRIEVLRVEEDGDELRVTFAASIGTGVGRWRGAAPPDRHAYDVELELDAPPERLVIVDGAASMTVHGARTTVRAIAEVDDDGFVYARLARDGLAMFDIVPGVRSDQTIELDLAWRELGLWPTGIDQPLRRHT